MSIVMSLAQEAATQVPFLPSVVEGGVLVAQSGGGAGGGILDWITTKNAQVQVVMRALSITIAIVFIIYCAIRARGTMGAIISSGIASAIFVWIVFNVTDLQARVDNEINAIGPASVVMVDSSPEAAVQRLAS